MKIIYSIVFVTVMLLAVSCKSTGVPAEAGLPWAGCGLGSFVQYKMIMPDGQVVQEKQEVIEVKSDQIMLESQALGQSNWEPKGKMIVPLHVPRRTPKGAVNLTQEQLVIAGKTVLCKVMEANGVRVWMSEDVPGGLVKRMSENMVVLEVVDFKKK